MAKSDLFKDQPSVPIAQKEGIQAILPGLSLSKILHDVGTELKEQAVMGSHELASALFRADAFVLYQRAGHDDGNGGNDGNVHGLPDMQQERGGREM